MNWWKAVSEDNVNFVGSIPVNYDGGLGPYLFADYAEDLASRIAALAPATVLELAAGTGIVTRKLRDTLDGFGEGAAPLGAVLNQELPNRGHRGRGAWNACSMMRPSPSTTHALSLYR